MYQNEYIQVSIHTYNYISSLLNSTRQPTIAESFKLILQECKTDEVIV